MSPYKPLLSQESYEQISNWLLEHAFKYKYEDLKAEMRKHSKSRAYEQHHRVHLLQTILEKLMKAGPIPSIEHPSFVKKLHDLVIEYLVCNPRVFDDDRLGAGRMVTGLRIIIVRAILDSDAHLVSDVEKALTLYFSNDDSKGDKTEQAWKQYVRDHNLSNEIRECCEKTMKYFRQRIPNASTHKAENFSTSSLKVWENIKTMLWKLLDLLDTSLSRTALDALTPGDSSFLDYVYRGIGDKSEERLLDFFRKVRNLKIESEFWLSLTRSDIEKC